LRLASPYGWLALDPYQTNRPWLALLYARGLRPAAPRNGSPQSVASMPHRGLCDKLFRQPFVGADIKEGVRVIHVRAKRL
jgi:hypothetical protein